LPPLTDQWRAVVTLGGPQASYEDNQYEYIKAEKAFLRHHIDRGTPVLGICLGAQIIADCIGGRTSKGPTLEAGVITATVTPFGINDPTIKRLMNYQHTNNSDEQPVTLSQSFISHHGDTFTLPPDCPPLLTTHYTQAYRYKSAFAVQFHPEATEKEMAAWVAGDSDAKLSSVGLTRDRLLTHVHDRSAAIRKSAEEFFNAWWTEIETGA